MTESTQRKLAAIVSADVVGYSRLIGADEASTLAALRAHRSELIDPLIAEHGGRIVKTMGDGLLLEFPSVVGAVNCSIAVQLGMAGRNETVDENRRLTFRIGVNLGDIAIDGDDIHGDGVNVAARLQEACRPGGLALSGVAHESLGNLVDTRFSDAGRQQFKNIAREVQVWNWSPEATVDPAGDEVPLSLPDKPSIAVLPFENMSGDPAQEYFSDGITEDIITTLCQFKDLHVIARNSTFTYKGQAVDLRAVGQELGVRNVLEGSVRRAGNRVRITAQLVEAKTGSHLWAERYDRPIDDIFEVQDEIAALVAGAINAELRDAQMERAARRGADTLAVWDLCAKAAWHLGRFNADDHRIGQELSRQAISLDAGYAESYAILSNASNIAGLHGWSELPPEECYKEAECHARSAIERDRNFVWAHCYLSAALLLMGRSDDAVSAGEHAVQLCPGLSRAQLALGIALAYSGAEESARAIEHLKTSIRLSPRDSSLVWTYTSLAAAEFMREGYDEAVRWARTGLQHNANLSGTHRALTASLVLNGDLRAAHLAYVELDRLQPGITIGATRDRVGHLFKRPPDLERYLDALRQAGLPE